RVVSHHQHPAPPLVLDPVAGGLARAVREAYTGRPVLRRHRGNGEAEAERAAPVDALAARPYPAAVQLHQVAHDGKPQARALSAPLRRGVDLVEPVPDQL